MKSSFLFGLAAAFGLAVCVGSGIAAEKKEAADKKPADGKGAFVCIFDRCDADGDGRITRCEYARGQRRWFAKLDENSDGKLDSDELIGKRFLEMDVNKDGVVTLEEYLVFYTGQPKAKKGKCGCSDRGPSQPTFERFDANKDGTISRSEMAKEIRCRFSKMDKNQDGKLTENEFDAATEAIFAVWDADQDGRLTLDEFLVARMPMKCGKCPCKCGTADGKGKGSCKCKRGTADAQVKCPCKGSCKCRGKAPSEAKDK